jgi:endoglucanase
VTGGSKSSGGTSASSGSSATAGSSAGNKSTGGTSATGGSTGGTSAAGGTATSGGTSATGGTTVSGGTPAAGGTRTGGTSATGGNSATGGTPSTGGSVGGSSGGLPALKVVGNKLQDPSGKTIVLRGSSLIDIGALYAYNGNSVKGITDRMDKLVAAGVQGHVVRFPVYPKVDYNAGYPYCSDLPYPVGSGPGTSCTAKSPMTAADYVSKVLKPAVDAATSRNLYVIIDHHQIDDATKGNSAADATTFWTDIAPKFASYANVLYEPFNEPIDGSATWATLKPVVQGWIDTIRKGAPDTIIIVPSNSYDQRPGDAASSPPSGTNLMYTAHIYPGNWNQTFQSQVATAVAKVPVFITEWGYTLNGGDATLGTSNASYGTSFQSQVDTYGASWTAWVTDNGWTPSMFSDTAITTLTDFGKVVKAWMAATATKDWVQ